jgi:membrane-bound lytic murein transglycosylase D
VRLTPGTATAYAASVDKNRDADKLETVVLRFGETLDDVARAHSCSVRELRRLNGVRETLELHGGTSIVVPRRAVAVKEKEKEKDADREGGKSASGDPAVDDDTVLVAVPDRSFSYDGRERVFYRTRDGDGLDEVADVFGVRTEDLCEWNNLDPTAKLHPRMVLQIFVRKDFDPAGVLLLDPTKVRVVTCGSEEFLELETARRGKKRLFYTAKAGDTLAKLGRRYGLTPGDLARINRFSYNTELHDGDRIVVYSPTGDAPREVTRGMTPGEKRPGRAAATTTTMPAGSHKTVADPEHKPATSTRDPKKKIAVATPKPTPAKPAAAHAKPAAGPAPGKKK